MKFHKRFIFVNVILLCVSKFLFADDDFLFAPDPSEVPEEPKVEENGYSNLGYYGLVMTSLCVIFYIAYYFWSKGIEKVPDFTSNHTQKPQQDNSSYGKLNQNTGHQNKKYNNPFESKQSKDPFETDDFSESDPGETKTIDVEQPLSEKDHAKVLGLGGSCTIQDIKVAFKKKMKDNHPDKINQMDEEIKRFAEERMKRINDAYQFFRDKYKF
jgi:hypothetical protein